MKLSKILKDIPELEIINGLEAEINNIQYNSQKIVKGDLFVCIVGYEVNGHNYIDAAIKNGAKVVVISQTINYSNYPNTIFIKTKNTRKFLALAAANYYDHPAKSMKIVGITGTKGKSTITYILKNILEKNNLKVGVIGTDGTFYADKKISNNNRTTPESLELQMILKTMQDANIQIVVMEVSSHALELYRVYGLNFTVAAFTNLTREHLGFHKTFANYFAAKAKLFDICDLAVINIDDRYGKKLYDNKEVSKISVGIKQQADIVPNKIAMGLDGTQLEIANLKFKTNLFGLFNVYNLLIAYAISQALNIEVIDIQKGFETITIPGRMEFVKNSKNYEIIIDFAHSVDSLEQALITLRPYVKKRLILVFGCGGGGLQDPIKRKMMGRIAAKYADYIILTADNPREEDPADICHVIETGINSETDYQIIVDREAAIKQALALYETGDLIILAGKGRETTQEYENQSIPFSDLETVQKYLLGTNQ